MCGIYGYIGSKPCSPVILEGLKKLEYRGYDSSGIATINAQKLSVIKNEGKLLQLQSIMHELPAEDTAGIGHTRWATHGKANRVNAHPHKGENFAIVHNGIIENYQELKNDLIVQGVQFKSQTDTEVVLQLIEQEFLKERNLEHVLAKIFTKLKGAFAFGVLALNAPRTIYLLRRNSPLVIGIGKNEYFFSSDVVALMSHTKHVVFMQDNEIAQLSDDSLKLWDESLKEKKFKIFTLGTYTDHPDKQGYSHYMLKEIYEQPNVISKNIEKYYDLTTNSANFQNFEAKKIEWRKVDRVCIVACGTAFYAGKIGQYYLEQCSIFPVSIDLASEFRYREPKINSQTLIIVVSQSGETADTLACVEHAQTYNSQILAICNSLYSSIARASTATLFMNAGVEIGVASTKAFSAMVFYFYLLGQYLKAQHKVGVSSQSHWDIEVLKILPSYMNSLLEKQDFFEKLVVSYACYKNFFYMGRGFSYSLAVEGALKLKEISYIYAEGYAGGELKHGPIALVDNNMPIVVIAPACEHYEKILSNVEEIYARGARIIGIGAHDDKRLQSFCQDYIPCPQVSEPILQTLLSVIPLQLFAYYMAKNLGTDVDQPRNLAKSVTVE